MTRSYYLRRVSLEELATGRLPAQPPPMVRIADVVDPGRPRWLVEGLWVSGAFGIVGAEPKSWKSMLTAWIGVHVAAGRPMWGRAVEQGRVLMLSVAGGPPLLRSRVARMCAAIEVRFGDLDLHAIDEPMMRLDEPAQMDRLAATVRELRPVLLVLDPLRDIHSLDENDAQLVTALLAPLRTLAVEERCAVMVVHHMAKLGDATSRRRSGQRLRGSSALHRAVDSALYLQPSGDGPDRTVTVEVEHRAAAPVEPFGMRLREAGEALWLEVAEAKTDDTETERAVAAREAARAKILRAVSLAAMPGRTPLPSKRAIATVAKLRLATAGKIIDELTEEGAIAFRAGAYRPAPTPPEGGSDEG